ncbi:MAG: hypothetical protein AAB573_04315 [Patescibacteria group bacterium]
MLPAHERIATAPARRLTKRLGIPTKIPETSKGVNVWAGQEFARRKEILEELDADIQRHRLHAIKSNDVQLEVHAIPRLNDAANIVRQARDVAYTAPAVETFDALVQTARDTVRKSRRWFIL